MRIAIFDKLDRLAPAYLVRRRTGDLMGIATQVVELVEYFFAHTVAPSFVEVLVPAEVLATLAWADVWLAVALASVLRGGGLWAGQERGRGGRHGVKEARVGGEAGG